MDCPKCGYELKNENGRLICLNCGFGKDSEIKPTDQATTSPIPAVNQSDPSGPNEMPDIPVNHEPANSLPSNAQSGERASELGAVEQKESEAKDQRPFLTGIELPPKEMVADNQMTGLNLKGKNVKVGTTSQTTPFMNLPNIQNINSDEKVKVNYKIIIFSVLIVLLIIATIIVGVIYYGKLTKVTMIGNEPTGKFTQEEVINCDEIGPNKQISDPTGKNQACIKENFLQCKPAKVNFASYGSVQGSTSSKPAPETLIEYQIVGPENNLCVVKIKYVKTPAPLPDVKEFDFNSKEMTCLFENTKDEVFQEVFGFVKGEYFTTLEKTTSQPDLKCTGPAYDLQQLMKKALNK